MLAMPLIILHVCSATVALLSGFMAMVFRKGSGWHGAAGTVFFVSLLSAAAAGGILAGFIHPNSGNVMGSTLTFYLVATGWMVIKRREGQAARVDRFALLWVLGIVALGVTWGIEAATSQSGSKDHYPASFYFIFASIALLFAASDIRMIVRGGVFGAKRIARHLWRMCMALLFAGFSFYPGQALRFFPKWLRDTNFPYVPHVLLVGAMFLWLYRVSARKRLPQRNVAGPIRGEALAANAPTLSGAR